MAVSSRSLPAALSLALSVAACGSATSDEGAPAGAGTGGSSTGQGGSGGAGVSLPDPGSPPASAVGIFSFQRLAGPTSKGGVTFGGWFQSPPRALSTPDVVSMLKGYPGIPLDTCSGPLPKYSVSGSQVTTLDGGALTIVDPSGASHAVKKQAVASFVTYQGELPEAAFVPGGRYALTAPSQQLAGDFYAPGALVLTSPSPSKPLTPDGKDLVVTWTSVPDGRPVLIRLHQDEIDVVCRVTDDGEFTIPAKVFQSFGKPSTEPGSTDEATFSVVHSAWWAMGDGANATLVFADVGAKLPMHLP